MSVAPDLVEFIQARLDDERAANLDATANRRLLREVATKRLIVTECDYLIRSSEDPVTRPARNCFAMPRKRGVREHIR